MQPFTVQTLAVSFLGLQLLLCSVHTCAAHSHGIKQKVCQTGLLHVSHSGARSVNESVTVLLHKTDRTQVTCVEPSQEYTVQLISYAKDIKGFILQADKGQFPSGRVRDLPYGAIEGPCNKSVSHRQLLRTRNLEFKFRSGRQAVTTFRFTVVFSMFEHMENQNVTFPKCPTPPPACENITSNAEGDDYQEPHDTNETEEPASEVAGICGKVVDSKSHMKLKISRNGIQYTCTSKNPIKQISCTSSCEGKCSCRPKNVIPKRRGFICRSCSPDAQDVFEETFRVKIPTRCVCFQCSNSPSLTGS